jgi:hypothetical protein
MFRHLMAKRWSARRGAACVASVAAVLSVTAMTLALVPPAQAAAPVNDTWETATAITDTPFRGEVDTTEATPDPGMGRFKHHSVWYSLELPNDGRVYLTLEGSEFEPQMLRMFQPESATKDPTDWTIVKSDRWGSERRPSRFVAEVEGGELYYLMIGTTSDGTGGTARLTVRRPARIHATLARFGAIDRVDGSAVLHGTIEATRRAEVNLSMEIRQRVGDRVVRADAFKSLEVTKKPDEWRLRFSAGRSFKPGKVRISRNDLTVYDGGLRVAAKHFVRTTVTLR